MTAQRARLAIGAGLVALTVAVGATAVVLAAPQPTPSTAIEIVIRYSKFEPSSITVPVGVPVTITLRNDDPIDHEWIVGDDAMHADHRLGTEPRHDARPTEITVDALTERRTTITFDQVGTLRFVCHLPGHEAYGMTGVLVVR